MFVLSSLQTPPVPLPSLQASRDGFVLGAGGARKALHY